MNNGDANLIGMLTGAGVGVTGVAAAENLSWTYTIGGIVFSLVGLLILAVKR